ncbi:hypothetical protein COO60DRAFT_1626673 [Scenedesmus sp. NREL 46B-D3]|nr:hypothetical protein COO60DRAFT_1626673 [Scenedesmus sp. NREL 46B-D3]
MPGSAVDDVAIVGLQLRSLDLLGYVMGGMVCLAPVAHLSQLTEVQLQVVQGLTKRGLLLLTQLKSRQSVTVSFNKEVAREDGAGNPSAFEKLVVRLIPRPSPRSIAVGDVVAFSSPLDPASSHSLMVRRVAALEGHTMYTTEDEDHTERVPGGHCWVLADNEELSPPDVIDSRAFGYLDMRLIMGRVLYRVRNASEHGRVANSPLLCMHCKCVAAAALALATAGWRLTGAFWFCKHRCDRSKCLHVAHVSHGATELQLVLPPKMQTMLGPDFSANPQLLAIILVQNNAQVHHFVKHTQPIMSAARNSRQNRHSRSIKHNKATARSMYDIQAADEQQIYWQKLPVAVATWCAGMATRL